MNKINLSAYQPIADIQDNIVFANNGNVVLCYEGNLPEIYSLSEKDFEDIHGTWFQALKSLPIGTVVPQTGHLFKKIIFFREASEHNISRKSHARAFQRAWTY